jgi:phosphatidylserine/phosphatidylglycerophosphate/cardiolipin synthase-like enzyme
MSVATTFSTSQLHDERTFYQAFLKDLENCEREVVIESPYVTSERMATLWPTLKKLLAKGVEVYFITRDPKEHDEFMVFQSEEEIKKCEIAGIQVLLCVGNHHRKLAFLDRKILWEGSLNILSQTHSREFMRRVENKEITIQTMEFLNLTKALY